MHSLSGLYNVIIQGILSYKPVHICLKMVTYEYEYTCIMNPWVIYFSISSDILQVNDAQILHILIYTCTYTHTHTFLYGCCTCDILYLFLIILKLLRGEIKLVSVQNFYGHAVISQHPQGVVSRTPLGFQILWMFMSLI